MSDSTRSTPRLALTIASSLAVLAGALLITGAAVTLSTGVSAPWLAIAAVVLIGSLTWLWGLRRK